MIIGHIYKTKRWGLLISIYETPSQNNLLRALAVGHIINVLIPFRIGDAVRVILSGRSLNNGYSLAIATVIIDLYLDLTCVGIIFIVLSLIYSGEGVQLEVAESYLAISIIIIALTLFSILYRKLIKKLIRIFASLFNENLEFLILYITYLTISSFKDIFTNIDKRYLLKYTIFMWTGYLISYVSFAEVIQKIGNYYSVYDIFATIFSNITFQRTDLSGALIIGAYLIIPLVLCLCYSIIPTYNIKQQTRQTLPILNKTDRVTFLNVYYLDENRQNLKYYLEMNKDVIVLFDNSAGSNATTITAYKNDILFYRKYAFNLDGERLRDQISWLEKYQNDLPLPFIIDKKIEKSIVFYDMSFLKGCVEFFEYIHTMPVEKSWHILENVIKDLQQSIYLKNVRINQSTLLNQYLKIKVEKNIHKIMRGSSYIIKLENNNSIVINGRELPTLNSYMNILSSANLMNIFKNDSYSEIHGDLTIENIICINNIEIFDLTLYEGKRIPNNYYLIDPNMGNIHDSPFLDYAKVLQSLHGGYEFLTKLESVDFGDNWINYSASSSYNYNSLYQLYSAYLKANFKMSEVRSIYYHEIIHWLRLLPYQIEKNEKLSLIFYARLLEILNDLAASEYEK